MLAELEDFQHITNATAKKCAVAKKVARFLSKEQDENEKNIIMSVAEMIAKDIDKSVREILAFELRNCKDLSYEVASIIARDIQSVAQPFLAETTAFSDEEMALLIPELEKFAHVTLAKRKNIGEKSTVALITFAEEQAVSYVVRNPALSLPERGFAYLLSEHGSNKNLMDALSTRNDLPTNVVEILIDKTSEACRKHLIDAYNMDQKVAMKLSRNAYYDSLSKQIENLSYDQIHGFVIDLKRAGKLYPATVLAMAEMAHVDFFVSAISVFAETTRADVRAVLERKDRTAFAKLLSKIKMEKNTKVHFLKQAMKVW